MATDASPMTVVSPLAVEAGDSEPSIVDGRGAGGALLRPDRDRSS